MKFTFGSNLFVNIVARLLVVLFIPLGIYSYTIIQKESDRHKTEQQVTASLLKSVGSVIQEDLDFLSQDLYALLSSKELNEYINNPSEEATEY